MDQIEHAARRLLQGSSASVDVPGIRFPIFLTPGSAFERGEPAIFVYAQGRLTYRILAFRPVLSMRLVACLYRPREAVALAQFLNLLLGAIIGTLSPNRETRGSIAASCRPLIGALTPMETTL